MSPTVVVFFVGLTIALTVIALALPAASTDPALDGEFDDLTGHEAPRTRAHTVASGFSRQVSLLVPKSVTEAASVNDGIIGLLRRSGNPWGITPAQFSLLRIGLAGVGIFIALLLPAVGYPLPLYLTIPGFAALGFVAPKALLSSKWSARRSDLQLGLPEALDLIRIAMNAGLSFTNALNEAMTHMRPSPTRDEFMRTAQDIRSGMSLADALADLRDRCPTDEMDAFTRAVVQGERSGADIARTIEHQAAEARRDYERVLEQKAAKMNTTLFLPIIFFLLPALLIFLFGSALDSLLNAL